MNLKQIPIIATPITARDLAQVFLLPFSRKPFCERFEEKLKTFFRVPHCHVTCSGRAAAFSIFEVLHSINERKKEIIIPAYVCASLVAAIRKARLIPKLCDISLDTFQMDPALLAKEISDRTLGVVPTHLFGIACDIEKINKIADARGCITVEDFAQSMGTSVNKRESGTCSSIAFTSFGRGKNLPTYSGGVVLVTEENLSRMIAERLRSFPNPSLKEKAAALTQLLIFSCIINPYIHKVFHKLILLLKGDDYPVADLKTRRYTEFQASVGNSILEKFDGYREKRYRNGMYLYRKLRLISFVRLPHLREDAHHAFNRFPVLFHEKKMREKAQERLLKAGVIACRLYTAPLHKLYTELWNGKGPDPYPNASMFSENSLTLPTHPLVDEKTLETIIGVFKAL